MNAPLNIGIAGLGTVGTGVLNLHRAHADLLERRGGRPIAVTAVAARDRTRDRGVDLSDLRWHESAVDLAADPAVDLVVELIGGADGVAKELCEAAIDHGKHVVTANKALMAEHGSGLARRAEAAGVALACEAAVAGGIPILKGLREGLSANRIDGLFGILNGTCNYILSEMRHSGRDFGAVLNEAQAHGYAEADPSFDIDGVDAAHKLAVLAGLAFNVEVSFSDIHVEGIRSVTALDIRFAEELGYRIKLLGLTRREETGIALRVHPCLVPADGQIAAVEGVFNAVIAQGDFAGPVMMVGRGAGAKPTASAVVADIVDIARGAAMPAYGVPAGSLARPPVVPMEGRVGAYYIRLMVADRPGVIADLTAHMRDYEVSVESFLQHGRHPVDAVPVVFTTHETGEAGMRQALAKIAAMDAVLEPPHMIRIETMID
ncbi:MAG: homoserine dehydrogenase [Inquilinaceae bacterium]